MYQIETLNFLGRCNWAHRSSSGRAAAGEVAVRPGGVLPDPVPQPAHPLREAPAPAPLPPHCLRLCDRTALLCPPRGQDAHRDAHQRHAALGQLLPVALRGCATTSSST